jgi:hypothetical protein
MTKRLALQHSHEAQAPKHGQNQKTKPPKNHPMRGRIRFPWNEPLIDDPDLHEIVNRMTRRERWNYALKLRSAYKKVERSIKLMPIYNSRN